MTTVKQIVKQAQTLGLKSNYKPNDNSFPGQRDQFSGSAMLDGSNSTFLIYFGCFEGDEQIEASFNVDVNATSSKVSFPVSAFMNMTEDQMQEVIDEAYEMRVASEVREDAIATLKEEGKKARATFRKSTGMFFRSKK